MSLTSKSAVVSTPVTLANVSLTNVSTKFIEVVLAAKTGASLLPLIVNATTVDAVVPFKSVPTMV